jgi:hypothetical protein
MKIRKQRSEKNTGEVTRRTFLCGLGGTAGLTVLASGKEPDITGSKGNILPENASELRAVQTRAERAFQVRIQAARRQKQAPLQRQQSNNDESLYPNKIATFTKGLVHNHKGEVDPKSYQAFKAALESGSFTSFENIPMGNSKKLVNPLIAYAGFFRSIGR